MNTPEQPNAVPAELNDKVQELVNVAFSESPEKAIEQAKESGNNALVDGLHAALSRPDIHTQLVERQKVKPAA